MLGVPDFLRWVSPNDGPHGAVRAQWDSRVGVPELRSFGGCPRMTFRSKWWVSPNEGSRRQNEGSFGGCPRFPAGGCPRISGCPRITASNYWDSRVGVPELRSERRARPTRGRNGGCPRFPPGRNGGCPQMTPWVSPNAGGCPQMTFSVTRHLLQAVFARRKKKPSALVGSAFTILC